MYFITFLFWGICFCLNNILFPFFLASLKKSIGGCLYRDKHTLLMLDLYRARRTTSTAAESTDNWHFLKMRVFIILLLSMGGPTADHTHSIFWKRSFDFVLYIQYVMQYSCFLTRRKSLFLKGERKNSIAIQSFAQNNTVWMWAFEKGICDLYISLLSEWLGSCRSATLKYTESNATNIPPEDIGY